MAQGLRQDAAPVRGSPRDSLVAIQRLDAGGKSHQGLVRVGALLAGGGLAGVLGTSQVGQLDGCVLGAGAALEAASLPEQGNKIVQIE